MMPPASLAEAARELARLSRAIAFALEAGDLDAAERAVDERGRLLDLVADRRLPVTGDTAAAMSEARAVIADADARSGAALERAAAEARAALGALGDGARALRAYLPAEPLSAGYVDRHD